VKKKSFIVLFIAFHVFFIGLKIDKQGRFIKLSYEKQSLETRKQNLQKKNQNLVNTLYTLKKPSSIKRFAQEKLDMEPLNLKRVKRIHTT